MPMPNTNFISGLVCCVSFVFFGFACFGYCRNLFDYHKNFLEGCSYFSTSLVYFM